MHEKNILRKLNIDSMSIEGLDFLIQQINLSNVNWKLKRQLILAINRRYNKSVRQARRSKKVQCNGKALSDLYRKPANSRLWKSSRLFKSR